MRERSPCADLNFGGKQCGENKRSTAVERAETFVGLVSGKLGWWMLKVVVRGEWCIVFEDSKGCLFV